MTELRQCRHYGYDNGMACGKGHSLKRFGFATAPCFPRNKETPCEGRDWITQEEIDAEEARHNELLELIFLARGAIIDTGEASGWVGCPKCGKLIRFAIADNGHCRAKCETSDCIQWME